ncbi:MAG: hypothetical protein R3C26_11005 [Calditrichia bacterium]
MKQFVFAVHHFSTTPLPADSALARQLASHLESIVPEVFALEQISDQTRLTQTQPLNLASPKKQPMSASKFTISLDVWLHTLVDEQMIPTLHTDGMD